MTELAPAGVLAQLRKRRAALGQERHLEVEVPGYSGMLHVRFHPVPWESMRAINDRADKKLRNNPRRDLIVQADTLISACEAMLYKDDAGLHVMGGEDNPVVFDTRLAEAVGLEGLTTAREVLFGVFPDELAVSAMFAQLLEWQGSGEQEDDETLLGEAESTESSS